MLAKLTQKLLDCRLKVDFLFLSELGRRPAGTETGRQQTGGALHPGEEVAEEEREQSSQREAGQGPGARESPPSQQDGGSQEKLRLLQRRQGGSKHKG